MSQGTYVVFLALVAFAAIPESTASPSRSYSGSYQIRRNGRIYNYYTRLLGNCIKKYGHSCMGGHGKRTQLPILPSYAIMSGSAQSGYIREKYPHSKMASKRRMSTSMHRGHSDQEYQSDVRFPELQISAEEIDNGFTDNRGFGVEFFAGNGLDDFKQSIIADKTFADQGYTSKQLAKNRLFEKLLFNLVNLRRQPYDTAEDDVDSY